MPNVLDGLTPREREVALLITYGMSNKAAARKLGISYRTVELHRRHIMQKLRVENFADLVMVVNEHWSAADPARLKSELRQVLHEASTALSQTLEAQAKLHRILNVIDAVTNADEETADLDFDLLDGIPSPNRASRG